MQKKELTMLKKISERLIGKPITTNCFANNLDLDSLMTGIQEEVSSTGNSIMREVQSKINKCIDQRRNSGQFDMETEFEESFFSMQRKQTFSMQDKRPVNTNTLRPVF